MKTSKLSTKFRIALSNLNWSTIRWGWKLHSTELQSYESAFVHPDYPLLITKEVWVHKRTGKRRTVTYFL